MVSGYYEEEQSRKSKMRDIYRTMEDIYTEHIEPEQIDLGSLEDTDEHVHNTTQNSSVTLKAFIKHVAICVKDLKETEKLVAEKILLYVIIKPGFCTEA